MEEFYRIRRLPPYVFEEVNRAKAGARNGGADIVDLGMGNPGPAGPAPRHRKVGTETAAGRAADRWRWLGVAWDYRPAGRLRRTYYERRFGVKLDPETQVVAIAGLEQRALPIWRRRSPRPATSSSAPIRAIRSTPSGFVMAYGVIRSVPSEPTPQFSEGGRARHHSFNPKPLPHRRLLSLQSDRLCREPGFLPGSGSVREQSTTSPSCRIWPTRKSVSTTTTRRRRCCRFPGAIDVTVEFPPRCRKRFSMAGWRMGFAVGNDRIIAALARGKNPISTTGRSRPFRSRRPPR